MPHDEPNATFAAFASVSGNDDSDVLSVDLEEGEEFRLQRVDVETESDPAGDVDVRAFYGDRPVAPENGVATMANDDMTLFGSAEFAGTDEIRVNVAKTTTGSVNVSVLVHGVLSK